jgi:hypothetical protein
MPSQAIACMVGVFKAAVNWSRLQHNEAGCYSGWLLVVYFVAQMREPVHIYKAVHAARQCHAGCARQCITLYQDAPHFIAECAATLITLVTKWQLLEHTNSIQTDPLQLYHTLDQSLTPVTLPI